MKKVVAILTAAVMLFSVFAFATDSDQVNARIKAAFSNDFSKASDVSWEKNSDFYFVTFTINKMEVTAAYNEEGELQGTSRTLETNQVPISVSLAVAKKYEGYAISDKALELTFQDETHYFITVSNDKQALKLKCSISGNIEVERRIKKK